MSSNDSDSDSSSVSSVETPPPKAKAPPAKKAAPAAAAASATKAKPKAGDKRKRAGSDDDEAADGRMDIGGNRFVSLSNFKGRFLVDIREFYEDKGSGEMKPGKRGIALSLEQWDNLKRKVDAVDKLIKDA